MDATADEVDLLCACRRDENPPRTDLILFYLHALARRSADQERGERGLSRGVVRESALPLFVSCCCVSVCLWVLVLASCRTRCNCIELGNEFESKEKKRTLLQDSTTAEEGNSCNTVAGKRSYCGYYGVSSLSIAAKT